MHVPRTPAELTFPPRLAASACKELRLLLDAAIQRHEARHRAAIEVALTHVPALLRGSVRSLLTD